MKKCVRKKLKKKKNNYYINNATNYNNYKLRAKNIKL